MFSLFLFSSLIFRFDERILVPRIRNITWLYRTVSGLKDEARLSGLYDYSFHTDYCFPYSERLFEDIQMDRKTYHMLEEKWIDLGRCCARRW